MPGWWKRKYQDTLDATAQVIVKRVGEEAWAIDNETKQVITHSTDHTKVIQTAINKLRGVGGSVFINGEFSLSKTITLYPGIALFGHGPTWATTVVTHGKISVIRASMDMNEPIIKVVVDPDNTSNTYFPIIRGITITGTSQAGLDNQHGIYISDENGDILDVYIEDVVISYASGDGIRVSGTGIKVWIRNTYLEVNAGSGLYIEKSGQYYIVEAYIFDNGKYGIYAYLKPEVMISLSTIQNNGYDGVKFDSGALRFISLGCRYINNGSGTGYSQVNFQWNSEVIMIGNHVAEGRDPPESDYLIRYNGTGGYGVITGNILVGDPIKGKIYNANPANIKIYKNYGFITEASGVATISAGSTSVTVSHGLASTPSKVLVTPYGNAHVWVENITSTTFDIVTDTAPASDLQVAWYAEV